MHAYMHGYILLGVFESSTKWSSVILSTDFHLRQNSSSYNFNVCVTTVHVAHRALILYMRIQCSAALSTVLVEMQVATKWVGMYQLRKQKFCSSSHAPKTSKNVFHNKNTFTYFAWCRLSLNCLQTQEHFVYQYW